MLTERSIFSRLGESDFAPAARSPVTRMTEPSLLYVAAGSYRPDKGSQLVAALLSAAVGAALFAALIAMHGTAQQRTLPRIVTMNLTLDPPQQPTPPKSHPKTAPIKSVSLATAPTPTVARPAPQPLAMAIPIASATSAPPAPPAPPVAAPAAASSPAQAGPADAGDMSARMVAFTAPTYPLDSRRAREQGTVVLTLLLGTDGRVSEIRVEQSSGSDRLDQAALSAVRRWRWAPIARDGQAVMVRGTVRIPFVLRG